MYCHLVCLVECVGDFAIRDFVVRNADHEETWLSSFVCNYIVMS